MENDFLPTIHDTIVSSLSIGRKRVLDRLSSHKEFIRGRNKIGDKVKYQNKTHDVGTVTAQETDIMMFVPAGVQRLSEQNYEVDYELARPENVFKSEQKPLFGDNHPMSP